MSVINDIEHESYSCLVSKLAVFENELRDHLIPMSIDQVDQSVLDITEYFQKRVTEMKARKKVLEAAFNNG